MHLKIENSFVNYLFLYLYMVYVWFLLVLKYWIIVYNLTLPTYIVSKNIKHSAFDIMNKILWIVQKNFIKKLIKSQQFYVTF